MFTLTLSSYFGSPGESRLRINVVINWQLSKQGIRWQVSPDHMAGSGVDQSRSSIFWSYPLTIYLFSNDCRVTFTFFKIHIKYVVFMSVSPRTITILISNWPQTQNFSQFFQNTGGEDLFLPWSRVGHADVRHWAIRAPSTCWAALDSWRPGCSWDIMGDEPCDEWQTTVKSTRQCH